MLIQKQPDFDIFNECNIEIDIINTHGDYNNDNQTVAITEMILLLYTRQRTEINRHERERERAKIKKNSTDTMIVTKITATFSTM